MDVYKLEQRIANLAGEGMMIYEKDGELGIEIMTLAEHISDVFDEGRYEEAERLLNEAVKKYNLQI